jgi:hypothetical protein
VRAHVIPQAFFREQRKRGEMPMLLTNTARQYPRQAHIGVYDQGILCQDCEAKFQTLDDYGIHVLLKEFDAFFSPVYDNGLVVEYQASRLDHDKLLRFLLSVLWRASVSTHSYYDKVDLGPYEADAATAITQPGNPVAPVFGAVLSRWRDTSEVEDIADVMLNPNREDLRGVNTYRLYLARVVAWVRVSNRPFGRLIEDFDLVRGLPIRVVVRDMMSSKDLAAMVKVIEHVDAIRPPRTP